MTTTQEETKPETAREELATSKPISTYNTVPIAIAIVVAGALIGGSIFLSANFDKLTGNNTNQLGVTAQNPQDAAAQQTALAKDKMADITNQDHIRGSADAKVFLVEYSDLDCPFCSQVHETLKQIINQYNGEVAWVYRHFPLPSLHPYAETKAQAAECVAELGGGSNAFWNFTDAYFPVQDPRQDVSFAVSTAGTLGINSSALNNCIESGKYKNKVQGQFDNAVESGGRGTPYIIITNGDEFAAVEGARSANVFTAHIDEMLSR